MCLCPTILVYREIKLFLVTEVNNLIAPVSRCNSNCYLLKCCSFIDANHIDKRGRTERFTGAIVLSAESIGINITE